MSQSSQPENWAEAMRDLQMDLRRDHAAIELLSKRLAKLIDTDASPEQLSDALSHLVETVAGHLAIEEATLYSDAMQSQPGITRDAVTRMASDFEQLKSNWTSYCAKWSATDIADDRQGFFAASKAILARLRDRVHLETELLVLAGGLEARRS